ncbi:tail-anchored protein insertion receptor WRB-like [Ceratina calcarata]|uniref:Guided entry of tail-anchored proteins factor 1 n=1 Tax=Ceratina calcarata TaxID=156304 RepID=A0AAJ7J1X3_9HYME|nr:tail-anchored protein insertion receptor WRB-like [Ceratina calcarata]XP_026670307.1 tail-anchored protein insertion receptor WRB-like [Ceratina calcarata]
MSLLIISTVSCLLEYIVPSFVKYATSRFYTRSKQDVELRNDLINVKQEMGGVSILDEFSKYAKLQRRYNKLENELKEKANERQWFRMKVEAYITYSFRILNGILILILLYLYGNKPVIILPKGILWPLQSLLSWPCYHEDSISLVMWLVIARLVVVMYKKNDIT